MDVRGLANYDSVFDHQNLVENLLCDYKRLASGNMFEDLNYFSRGQNQDHVAGYAFDNIPIFNALSVDNHSSSSELSCEEEENGCDDESDIDYHDALEAEIEAMDTCLTYSSLDNVLHYHALGRCMKSFNTLLTGTDSPTLCKEESEDERTNKKCTQDPFSWARLTPPSPYTDNPFTDKTLTDIGLARDGHVIKGPYNENGELWTCEDVDICNGTFLEDGSYVYVATSTFPYTVGCWGPGTQQLMPVSNECSRRGCGYQYESEWEVPKWSDTRKYPGSSGAIAISTTIGVAIAMTAILI